MATSKIFYYEVPTQDLLDSGYTTKGWYFWDETDAACFGPFASYNIAYDELQTYFAFLHYGGTP